MTMKTPEQIARHYLDGVLGNAPSERMDALDSDDYVQLLDMVTAAIEFDRAQRETVRFGQVRFTVEFDNPVWASLTEYQRMEWAHHVEDAINEEAHVSQVEGGWSCPVTTHDSRCTLGSDHEGPCNVKEWRG